MRISVLPFLVGAVAGLVDRPHTSTARFRAGYTTITPSGSHGPVTVTAQYQPIPTYVPEASTYTQYLWVSTVLPDANGEQCTVTKTEQPVTIHHTRTTITHTNTKARLDPTASATGTYGNGTTVATFETTKWEELYEVIGEIEYHNLGSYAISGYPGSGLCGYKCHGDNGVEYQPVHVRKYKDGKWFTYNTTYTYGLPTPTVTTYQDPGVYTVPAYNITLYHTMAIPTEATYTASANTKVTYGGLFTSVSESCTITAQYAAYKTEGAMTTPIIKTTTIYASQAGYYNIVRPTITSYKHQTECVFPTATIYQPGVYHHGKETVTITKSKQAYTCSYPEVPGTSEHSTTKGIDSPPTITSNTYSGVVLGTSSSQPGNGYPTRISSFTATHTTHTPSHTEGDDYTTVSPVQSPGPDPSSDLEEVEEMYGTADAGYVKRGGMLERRKAKRVSRSVGKRVILV